MSVVSPSLALKSIRLHDLSPIKSFSLHLNRKYFSKIDEHHCQTSLVKESSKGKSRNNSCTVATQWRHVRDPGGHVP